MSDTDANQQPAQIDNPNSGPDIYCLGEWNIAGICTFERQHDTPSLPQTDLINIDGYSISDMDSAGAWVLLRFINKLKNQNKTITYSGFRQDHQDLLDLVASEEEKITQPEAPPPNHGSFFIIGRETVDKCLHAGAFLSFVGELMMTFISSLFRPKTIQWRSILNCIDEIGYRSLPIIALLMFLIGVVLSYQIGVQLKTYGANIFIVGLTGMAILREFSPLIVAIIIAGRSGSAFTAQIGTMIVNEEVDALSAMGLSPLNRLVIPKFIGAIVALPLLVIWGDIFGIMGSMAMAKTSLNISYYDFMIRLQTDVPIRHFYVGLLKAPFFAMIIATVGCFQGFRVTQSAASVGYHTTQSVVQSIFLIIIIDAMFSILFSVIGI